MMVGAVHVTGALLLLCAAIVRSKEIGKARFVTQSEENKKNRDRSVVAMWVH